MDRFAFGGLVFAGAYKGHRVGVSGSTNRVLFRRLAVSEQRPQLHMRRALADLPPVVVPDGYALRCFRPGDEQAWATLMAGNGELGEWNVEKAAAYFAADSRMPLDGAFFITVDGVPVATAQLHLKPGGTYAPTPEVGWVAVHPAHQGRRLAAVVSLAVMHYAAAQGHREVYLLTDDWRLAAVKTYLNLGFEPWLVDATAPERWRAVREQLERRAGREVT